MMTATDTGLSGNTALQSLALADDLQATRAAEYVYEHLLAALGASGDTTLLESPAAPLEPLRDAVQRGDVLLSDTESVSVARWVLSALTATPDGQRLVERALAEWKDDTQRVGVRLQWTLAGTLLLLVATTDVEYGPQGLHIHKKTVIPQQVEATLTFIRAKVSVKVFDPSTPAQLPPGAQSGKAPPALPPAAP